MSERPKGHLTVMRGLPGSGKSRHAGFQALLHDEVAVVSRDSIRAMLKPWGYEQDEHGQLYEQAITEIQEAAVSRLLKDGRAVILDDTNLPQRRVRTWLGFAENHGATWDVYDFTDASLEVCLARNAGRERPVPSRVIGNMHERFVKGQAVPIEWEPLRTSDAVQGEPYEMPSGKPWAVIVDIDGTLAKMNGRSPYDYSRVLEDLPNWNVIDLVEDLAVAGSEVILMSGRPESCRVDTQEWLARHGVGYSALHMRSNEEYEQGVRDDKVKLRLFNEHVRDNYRVMAVLDDRDRVVRMWRQLGLTCLQVDYGDF
ncbi:AAA family ATPase [Nesterenkonia sp. CL21]|uniref:phosphatase domain-containing protein n=1 Tax=Nesterenkonia sp. CL21 TaxID=3064894 RepID=UPI00287952B6|nr:AAA family ATPase [Nesterenkonia sp. CL21]MDS2171640.1 AAA family ATPase [Nesterenkonia sp. CL21]